MYCDSQLIGEYVFALLTRITLAPEHFQGSLHIQVHGTARRTPRIFASQIRRSPGWLGQIRTRSGFMWLDLFSHRRTEPSGVNFVSGIGEQLQIFLRLTASHFFPE